MLNNQGYLIVSFVPLSVPTRYLSAATNKSRALEKDYDVRVTNQNQEHCYFLLEKVKESVYKIRLLSQPDHFVFCSNDNVRKFKDQFDVRTHAFDENRNNWIIENFGWSCYTIRSETNPDQYMFIADDFSNQHEGEFDVRTHSNKDEIKSLWFIITTPNILHQYPLLHQHKIVQFRPSHINKNYLTISNNHAQFKQDFIAKVTSINNLSSSFYLEQVHDNKYCLNNFNLRFYYSISKMLLNAIYNQKQLFFFLCYYIILLGLFLIHFKCYLQLMINNLINGETLMSDFIHLKKKEIIGQQNKLGMDNGLLNQLLILINFCLQSKMKQTERNSQSELIHRLKIEIDGLLMGFNSDLLKNIYNQNILNSQRMALQQDNQNLYIIDKTKVIGMGSFGQVYECKRQDNKQTRPLCVKIIPKQKNYQNQWKQEIQILNKLKEIESDNLVRVEYIGNHPHQFQIVMEKCDMDLEREFKILKEDEQWYNPAEQIDLLKQIAEGSRILYKNNIVHRDIKPSNILVKIVNKGSENEKRLYQISDFGLGKILDNYCVLLDDQELLINFKF